MGMGLPNDLKLILRYVCLSYYLQYADIACIIDLITLQ